MARFKRVNCPRCGGYGIVSNWGEADDCTECGSSGFFYISDGDRLFDYPGGPIRGTWPGKFQKLEDEGVPDYEQIGRSVKDCLKFCRAKCTRKLGWNDDKRFYCMENSSCVQFDRFLNREE